MKRIPCRAASSRAPHSFRFALRIWDDQHDDMNKTSCNHGSPYSEGITKQPKTIVSEQCQLELANRSWEEPEPMRKVPRVVRKRRSCMPASGRSDVREELFSLHARDQKPRLVLPLLGRALTTRCDVTHLGDEAETFHNSVTCLPFGRWKCHRGLIHMNSSLETHTWRINSPQNLQRYSLTSESLRCHRSIGSGCWQILGSAEGSPRGSPSRFFLRMNQGLRYGLPRMSKRSEP